MIGGWASSFEACSVPARIGPTCDRVGGGLAAQEVWRPPKRGGLPQPDRHPKKAGVVKASVIPGRAYPGLWMNLFAIGTTDLLGCGVFGQVLRQR